MEAGSAVIRTPRTTYSRTRWADWHASVPEVYIQQITYESYDNTYYTYWSSDFCPPSVGVCVLVVGSLLFASAIQPLQYYEMILQSFKEVPVTVNPLAPVVSISYLVSPQAYGNLYGGFNTRRYILVHGLCFF